MIPKAGNYYRHIYCKSEYIVRVDNVDGPTVAAKHYIYLGTNDTIYEVCKSPIFSNGGEKEVEWEMASPEEIAWLDACIKAGKLVPKVSLKSLTYEIY